MQVCLNLLLENKHPKLAMRSLIHGLGLYAHFVLLWGQLIQALLFMPQMEKTPDRRSDHHEVAVNVFAVQMYIFTTPSFNVQIKATYVDKIRSVLASHPKPKVSPKSSFFFNNQLLF